MLGHIANVSKIDSKTIGSIPRLSAKVTTIGAIKTPYKLMASITPQAVD